MIARQFDPVTELQSAFTVLTKNLTLAAIPTAAAIIVCAVLVLTLVATGASALIASGLSDPTAIGTAVAAGIGSLLFGLGITLVIGIIVGLLAQAAVIAGSEAVWEGRPPDLGVGLRTAMERAGDLFIGGLLLALIFIAISWTLVGPLVLAFLMVYFAPAVVVGREGGIAAIGTSWRMATQNFGPTFAAFAGIVIMAVIGGVVQAILGHLPILGWVAALLVSGFTAAYGALVAVRFYDLLRGGGMPLARPASPPTPTPPPPPTPVS